jgi:hypothetical protein
MSTEPKTIQKALLTNLTTEKRAAKDIAKKAHHANIKRAITRMRSQYYTKRKQAHTKVFTDTQTQKPEPLAFQHKGNIVTGSSLPTLIAHQYSTQHPYKVTKIDTLPLSPPWEDTTNPDPFILLANPPKPNHIPQKITYNLVHDLIRNMKNGKASGPDNTSTDILKRMPTKFIELTTTLLQKLWDQAHTPNPWKKSTTVLIHKKGDPTLLQNWRPIALVNVLFKLWTGVITTLLSDYCEQNKILHQTQEGFRRTKNTMNQLTRVITMLEDANLTNKQLHMLYIDFENAFGSTDHQKLIYTLQRLGIPQYMIQVIKTIYVGEGPNPITTNIRLPMGPTPDIEIRRGNIQGDTLSPLLFLLYIEPLLRWLNQGNRGYKHGTCPTHTTSTAAYADDLCIPSSTLENLKIQMHKIQKFSEWSGLRVNPKKCAVTGINTGHGKHI